MIHLGKGGRAGVSHSVNDIMDVCLSAGELMLKSGAETYRVEDTMTRIARSFGMEIVHAYVTPTAIILSVQGDDPSETQTKLCRITERSIDLYKVTLVNALSRRLANGELTFAEMKRALEKAEKTTFLYPLWLQVVSAAIGSGCFALMFQGGWTDFIPSVIAGGSGYIVFIALHRFVRIKFFSELVAAFTIGLIAEWMVMLGIGERLDKIIIGSVMPLVPGLFITNAVRDLMAGDLLSGLSRGVEAFLTAFAIGTGIAVVLAIF
ncbi:threonine/serine exporter family protein [Caenibacillus caldisaponilyticus]|uniref:threonine/serine exporter family protein n=1 Tax=Caenibacillus caldisaponilyticus TaxID=1674942 RepID=UPI000988390B